MKDEVSEHIYQNQQIIIRICKGFFYDQADREDLFQEIVYKVLASYGKFRQESSFTTWLYRIAINTAITYSRKKKKFPLVEAPFPDVSDTDQLAYDDEDIKMLYRAIERLNRIDKAIILLYLEEKTYEEISDITGYTTKNISGRIHRIKKKLKEILDSII